ncbi:hypothetical protein [Actinokineospora sp.]|uniref:hypothetical protein n=1 Tax=Actinokineospora sp. TaxID=1872133 RepID=UPI003D6A85BC
MEPTDHLQRLLRRQTALMNDLPGAHQAGEDQRVLDLRAELDAIAAAATRIAQQ